MIIQGPEVESIENKKVTFVKNFTQLKTNYDFNFISKLLEENEIHVRCLSDFENLRDIFQALKVHSSIEEFLIYLDFLKKLFKYNPNEKDRVDLFFSLVSQVGFPHIDPEDVFILGLKGKTIYKVFDTETIDYMVSENDLIFIPKGIKHKVIGITPRIIASIGFFGDRLNGQENV